jgi:hypothetical protein
MPMLFRSYSLPNLTKPYLNRVSSHFPTKVIKVMVFPRGLYFRGSLENGLSYRKIPSYPAMIAIQQDDR